MLTLGCVRKKPLLELLQLVQPHRVNGGDVDGAHHVRGLLADFHLHLAKAGEDFLAPPEEPLPGGRGRHLARAPAEQLLAVAGFQRPNLLAHRGLGDVVELRRTREGAGFHHVAKHFQRLELH